MPDLPSLDTKLTRADYTRLARELAESPSSTRKVAILASFTADFLEPCLIVEAARREFPSTVWLAPFGQIEQQVVDPGSALYAEKPDIILVLVRHEDWRKDAAHRLHFIAETLRKASTAKIVLGNFAPPTWQASGLASSEDASALQKLNDVVASTCAQISDCALLDIARVATEVGLTHWRDERLEYLAKAPWSAEACAAVAKRAARVMRALFVPPKKCLVLDMDNTLWGGVLGEVGLDGIQLGPDYPGNVFLEFQRHVLALRDCGVLLAAASKNNAADVEDVLARHPSCLLKREHFAAFEVHWEDKATSHRRIAEALNIGIDSLVFFDDNPAEREWVKQQLPQVAVLEVPKSPMGYAQLLDQCGHFDMTHLTREDRQRAQLYQQDVERQQLRTVATSLDDYLRSLEMKLTIGVVTDESLPRVVQLLGKTNQFNLTTRRHSSADVQQMIEQGAVALWAKLEDRFGDNGLIAAAIALPESSERWRIDTFLMSCRVIGRGVETALLKAIEDQVRARGAVVMNAEFIPTAKNQPAVDLLPKHGYIQAASGMWERSLAEPRAEVAYLTILFGTGMGDHSSKGQG